LVAINPIGNFPLNDDWAFGLTVKHLIEFGEFRPSGWASMPLLTNTIWGALFCLPSGFSFNALRVSTLALSLGGMLGTYWLGRELRLTRGWSMICALVMGFNPIYFALSNTFMTDVPFTAMTVFALVFLVKNLAGGSKRDWFIGLFFAVAATLSRQLAIAVPLAFAVTLILRDGIVRRNILRAVSPAVFCIGSLWVLQNWLVATGRIPSNYNAKNELLLVVLSHPGWLPDSMEVKTYSCLLYLGLFLSPILALVLPALWAIHRKKTAATLAFSSLFILHSALKYNEFYDTALMPTALNILVKSGIGPVTLRVLDLNHPAVLPPCFWLGVTVVSLLSAVALLAVAGVAIIQLIAGCRAKNLRASDPGVIFLLLTTAIYLLPLLAGGFFDRYLIFAVPLLAVCIASSIDDFSAFRLRSVNTLALALSVGLGFFAIAGTRDYLEWNRMRWRAITELTASRQARLNEIDGGFEFGGYYFYDPHYQPDGHKSWWWVHDDTYRISFDPVPGFSIVKEYDYVNWLPPRRGRICVLKKIPGNSPP
jgi:4-amino-4-deoxy-L-arabinose transferase-like glycosyltransferase